MDETVEPIHLNVMFSPHFAVPIFGFVVPPLAGVICIVNVFLVWIITKRNMVSPPNVLLACIALSDSLAIVLPSAPFIYFYTLGNYKDFLPFPWCRVFFLCVHILPLLCNMAALWSTAALAFMRCYCVWRPLRARSNVTTFRTYVAVAVIYIMSVAVYFPLFFEYTYEPVSVPSMRTPNSTIATCRMQINDAHLSPGFCRAHSWIQIVFTSLLPWLLILFPDAGLLWKLKKAEEERKILQDTDAQKKMIPNGSAVSKAHSTMVSRRRNTTLIIFIVVSMIWLVEIPFAVSFTMHLIKSNGDVMRNVIGDSMVIVLLLRYITYPVIFLIYCFMSQKFRRAFKNSILCFSNKRQDSFYRGTDTKDSSGLSWNHSTPARRQSV